MPYLAKKPQYGGEQMRSAPLAGTPQHIQTGQPGVAEQYLSSKAAGFTQGIADDVISGKKSVTESLVGKGPLAGAKYLAAEDLNKAGQDALAAGATLVEAQKAHAVAESAATGLKAAEIFEGAEATKGLLGAAGKVGATTGAAGALGPLAVAYGATKLIRRGGGK